MTLVARRDAAEMNLRLYATARPCRHRSHRDHNNWATD
jgi:hypothetical protein